MMHYNNWFRDGFCSFGFGYFSLWHLLILIGVTIVIVGIVVFIAKGKSKHRSDDALEQLKRLYVNGDITEDEYLKKKNILEKE